MIIEFGMREREGEGERKGWEMSRRVRAQKVNEFDRDEISYTPTELQTSCA